MINPATGEPEDITASVADMFCKAWGEGLSWSKDINPIYHEARNLSLDITKAKRTLGWKPRWPLSKAIDKIVEWHKAHLEGRDCLALTRKQIEEFLKQ